MLLFFISTSNYESSTTGYYTNLTLTEKFTAKDIVSRYKDLWHVEQSFRIAKSDLEARPIFHRKQDSITAHMLIVFISLCLARIIEKETGQTLRTVRDMIWQIQDITFTDTATGKQYCKRMETTSNPMAAYLEKRKREQQATVDTTY